MSLSPRARPRSRLNKAEKKSMDTVELRPLENSEAPADIVQEVVIEETTSLTEWDEDVLRQSAAGMCCSKDYELQQFIHLPDYLKHNPHITHGYRVGLTLRQTTFSLFHWHNETLNVWTHLGGLFLFLVLAITSYTTWLNRAVIGELVTSTVFFLSAMMMLLFSSVFHLYNCCSDRHYDFTAKLDYSGIAVLIAGSYYPLLYYIYYCPNQYLWRYGYGVIITGFGVAALWVIWKGKMHQAGNEALRLFVFLGMGLFGVIPLPQSLVRYFPGKILSKSVTGRQYDQIVAFHNLPLSNLRFPNPLLRFLVLLTSSHTDGTSCLRS